MKGLAALTMLLVASACGDDGVESEAPPQGMPAACEGFELQGDLVVDQRTGLVWDRRVEQSFHTHQEAALICAARGARLPTRAELLALRVENAEDPCRLPACPFTGPRCLTIQCGSAVPGADAMWGVAMSGGALVSVPVGRAEALLCVRDPRG